MKKHSKIKAAFLLALALVVGFAPVANVSAADESTDPITSVSPPMTKITIQPGDTYRASFRLSNTGNGTLEYKVYATPYSISSDDEKYQNPNYSDSTKYSKISEWVKVDESDTTGSLEPLAQTEINYTINVPDNASPGGQYAAIIVERTNLSSGGVSNANVVSVPRVAYIIYASVAGQADRSGTISQNDINAFFLSTPISVTSLVENTGNVHSDAEYILQVYPLFSDEEIYTNEENPETRIVLPETRRFTTVSWDESPNIGIFKVKQTVKFAGTESVSEKLVVVCPMWLLLAIVFVIVFWIIWLVMRNKNRKAAGKGKSSSKSSSTHSSDHKPEKPADSKPDSPESN